MAKGWKLEPGRHALAAKGVPTGRKARYTVRKETCAESWDIAGDILDIESDRITDNPQATVDTFSWDIKLTPSEIKKIKEDFYLSRQDIKDFDESMYQNHIDRSLPIDEMFEATSDLRDDFTARKLMDIVPRLKKKRAMM